MIGEKSRKRELYGVLLWDIDGTLLKKESRRRQSIHVDALGAILPPNFDLETSGLSDWDVLFRYVEYFGLPATLVPKAFRKLDLLKPNSHENRLETCPGIGTEFMRQVSENWINGILTGNTSLRGRVKLQQIGLLECFDEDFMFFCKSEESRIDIARRARMQLEKFGYPAVVIGDTEIDIITARAVELPVVSVATGSRSRSFLERFVPDLIYSNLEIKELLFDLKNLVTSLQSKK